MTSRYTFTRPKTSTGPADFYEFLKTVNNDPSISMNETKRVGVYMTFQALRDYELISYDTQDKVYTITLKGKMYIKYVDSSNKPLKKVLKAILEKRL